MKYKLVACGGTFDFLHQGHTAFLTFAFSLGEKVLIGVTSDEYVLEQKTGKVTPFIQRKKTLEAFLQQQNLSSRATIIPIHTIYGPTLDATYPLEAIVVTEETKKNAEHINAERHKKGLPLLVIESMPLVKKNDHIISSSAIRSGLFDTEWKRAVDPSVFHQAYQLPKTLRSSLRKPFGALMKDGFEVIKELDPEKIITVGDVTTARFNKQQIHQKISVIDFVIERKKSHQTLPELGFSGDEEVLHVVNPPGTLTPQTWQTIESLMHRLQEKKQCIIAVDGEEDLLVIPFLLLFPFGYHLFYGQPQEGLVHAESTPVMRQVMDKLFHQFTPVTTRGY